MGRELNMKENNEKDLTGIGHTTKELNKYFAKLKYIVNNYEKLEKRVIELEKQIKKQPITIIGYNAHP